MDQNTIEPNENGGIVISDNEVSHGNVNGRQNRQPTFDWVTARAACSLPRVFKDLRLRIEEDVKTRNSLRLKNAPYEFFVAEAEKGFKVVLQSDSIAMAVTFVLGEHAILVRGNAGTPMFDVSLNFTDRGECKLMVDGEEREMWQVERMALEELMFRSL